jgi:DNA-directed RNA polymerase specialized sigma24 family protein
VNYDDIEETDELLLNEAYKKRLRPALESLNAVEKDLVMHVYSRHYSIKSYSMLKGIPYSTAVRRKNSILRKLKKALMFQPDCRFKN